MKRIMRNEIGQIREVKEGFSWTTLFFGSLVPLCRGDWKWFLIMMVASFLTFGISHLVFCFMYNKFYVNDLIKEGYRFTNVATVEV